MKGFSSKRIALKVDVIGPENNYTVCRRVRASFSPEVFQIGAVKELNPRNETLPQTDVVWPGGFDSFLFCFIFHWRQSVEATLSLHPYDAVVSLMDLIPTPVGLSFYR